MSPKLRSSTVLPKKEIDVNVNDRRRNRGQKNFSWTRPGIRMEVFLNLAVIRQKHRAQLIQEKRERKIT